MRIARDCGDVSALLPPGVTHLADMPYTFFDAVRTALAFLGYDELPKEERPPKRIWLNGKAMSAWWQKVERERDRKYGTDRDNGPGEESGLIDDLIVG